MPIVRSSITAVATSGLPLERGGSSAVGRPDHDKLVFYEYEILKSLEILYSREWAVNFVPVSG
jgi:hypothetical protein